MLDTEDLDRLSGLVYLAAKQGVGDEINAARPYKVQRSQSWVPNSTSQPSPYVLPAIAQQLVVVRGIIVCFNPASSVTQFRLQVGSSGNPFLVDFPLAGGFFNLSPLELELAANDPIQVIITGIPANNPAALSLLAWGEQQPVLGTAT